MKTPKNAEIRYVKDLLRIWRRAQSLLSWGIKPLVEQWPTEKKDDEVEDRIVEELGNWFDMMARGGSEIVEKLDLDAPRPVVNEIDELTISKTFDFIRLIMGQWLEYEDDADYGGIFSTTAEYIDQYVWRELGQVLNIDLRRDIPGLDILIERWRGANVELIESAITGPSDGVRLKPLLDDVSSTIEIAHRKGWRWDKLAMELQDRYLVSNSRASLIARDQVLKLNGKISKHRQEAVGIDEYKWSTSRDERVRKSHQRLNGTIHKWTAPPIVDGEEAHPGDPPQCRCIAIPVPPRWLNPRI